MFFKKDITYDKMSFRSKIILIQMVLKPTKILKFLWIQILTPKKYYDKLLHNQETKKKLRY
jgi:hypothetical protein